MKYDQTWKHKEELLDSIPRQKALQIITELLIGLSYKTLGEVFKGE